MPDSGSWKLRHCAATVAGCTENLMSSKFALKPSMTSPVSGAVRSTRTAQTKRQQPLLTLPCGCSLWLVSLLVSWCFKPSQPQRIISGLKETFIKRCIVERTDKAETRPEKYNEKDEKCQENLWNVIQLKGLQSQK